MTTNRSTTLIRGRRAGSRWGVVLALALLGGAGCDAFENLLEVDAPSRIPASQLESPANAQLLLNGAIGDFECALGSYVVLTGIMGEELVDATQTANRWPYDRREVAPDESRYSTFGCTSLGVYTPLSTARWAAENVLQRLEGWSDAEMPEGMDRTSMIATAAAYSGYAHLLLGEAFCTGVLLDASLTPGGEVNRVELFRRAEERFTRAIEAARASGNDEILNMALVGRARARLDLQKNAEAAADARQVAAGFVMEASASTTASRRENRVFAENNNSQLVSVGEPYRNLTFQGVEDPRVEVVNTGRTATDGTPIWTQQKYASLSAPLPIATWDEAQLIIAEIEGGQTAVDIINMFHARAGLPAFTSTDPAAIRQQVVQERSRELFLEGHRLNDVRRLSLPLSPAPGTTYRNGGVYGTTTCLPLPNVERLNNPNI